MTVYVARPSGLLVAFDPPELTVTAAADRDDARALEPEYLPTYPLSGAFEVRHRWPGPPPSFHYVLPAGPIPPAPLAGRLSALSDLVDPGEPQCGARPPDQPSGPACARPPLNHGGKYGRHESDHYMWNDRGWFEVKGYTAPTDMGGGERVLPMIGPLS